MNKVELNIGDVVYLVSGSPALTVIGLGVSPDKVYTLASVAWFCENSGQLCSATLPTVCLEAEKVDAVGRALIDG